MEIRKGTIVKITKKDPMFKRVKFVISARRRDKECYFSTRFVHSDGERLVATDGHRLHCAEGIGIPDGLYNVILNTPTIVSLEEAESETDFPEFEKLLSEDLPKTGYSLSGTDYIDYAVVSKILPDGSGINYEFFKDLHGLCHTMFCSSDLKKLIIFRGEEVTAAIMPFTM